MRTSKAIRAPIYGNSERGDAARKKLIEAGLKIFSELGYKGASTRSLAAAAGVNVAAIPYYFGSKEGLYIAVIDYIIDYHQKGLGDFLAKIQRALLNERTTRTEYRELFDEYMRTLIYFVLQEGRERSQISHICIREQLDPTSAFDRLYEGFIHHAQETVAALVGCIVGANIPASEVKLVTQTLLGQISVFILSKETILHNMDWKNYGEKGVTEIERVVMFHQNVIMQAYQKKIPPP
jgi:AcrR family transcriptional regulator